MTTVLKHGAIDSKGQFVYFDSGSIRTNKIPKLSGLFDSAADVEDKIQRGRNKKHRIILNNIDFWNKTLSESKHNGSTDYRIKTLESGVERAQRELLNLQHAQYTLVTIETTTTLGKVV